MACAATGGNGRLRKPVRDTLLDAQAARPIQILPTVVVFSNLPSVVYYF